MVSVLCLKIVYFSMLRVSVDLSVSGNVLTAPKIVYYF